MSIDRHYYRSRSPSPYGYRIGRSVSVDPYIYLRTDICSAYDQHVRRSFSPAREKVSETICKYYFTPPYHYQRPGVLYSEALGDFSYSAYREGRRPPFRASNHVFEDRPSRRGNPRYNIYQPSGWATPVYKYLNPSGFRHHHHHFGRINDYSLASTFNPQITRAYSVSHWHDSYRPSYSSGEIYHYQAEPKKSAGYRWKHWLDRDTILPWYKSYLSDSESNRFAGHTSRHAGHYCSRAIWI